MKGVAAEKLAAYDSKVSFTGLEFLKKPLRQMRELTENAIEYVRNKNDSLYQEYHSRRLVEMVTNTIIGYLMLRDAGHSEEERTWPSISSRWHFPRSRHAMRS